MSALEQHLRARRDAGRKLLVPYVMAGSRSDWLDIVRTIVDAGADAVEIGIPFSDPVMDGPVIQQAAVSALDAGTTPSSVLEALSPATSDVPLAVMTYYNLVARLGLARFAERAKEAGIDGVILPDLPLDESAPWRQAAARAGLDAVMLVAPNTPDARLARICDAGTGFVYAVGTLGVTGERNQLAASATQLADRVRAITDMPVLIGVGVSTPQQAAQAVTSADGVVIGSTVVRRMNDGESPESIGELISQFRKAIDEGRSAIDKGE